MVLLVSSRGGAAAAAARAPSFDGACPPAGAWVLPKGGWEDDEAVEAAARRETVEEAGVRGVVDGPPLGAFSFEGACKVQAARPVLVAAGNVADGGGSISAPPPPLLAAQSSTFEASASAGGTAGGGGGDALPPPAAAAASAAAAAAAGTTLLPDDLAQPTARRRRGLAHMFVLRVQEELETWPEAAQRERRWVPLPEAPALCRHAWMREALRAYGVRLFPADTAA